MNNGKLKFLTDVRAIRERARRHMEQGAVTEGFKGDRQQLIKVLNDSLATEIVCVLRYKFHYYEAAGLDSASIAEEFLEHAKSEQEHADRLAERISQLGGKPDFMPDSLTARSLTEYKEGSSLVEMIKEDLVAERIVIDSYLELVRWIGDGDPTTRGLIEDLLADEEAHAHELQHLLKGLESRAK
ncbi:MAG: bacterioferritin [Elusimicrobia bacterium]|nr:bacterioferritin [Elusimicrobiota bacterium]